MSTGVERANERGDEGGEPMSAGLLRRRCSECDLESYAAAAATNHMTYTIQENS